MKYLSFKGQIAYNNMKIIIGREMGLSMLKNEFGFFAHPTEKYVKI